MARKRPASRISNSLVGLSSVAIMAVYAAGYARTEPAAKKLGEQPEIRPHAHPATALTPQRVAEALAATPAPSPRPKPAPAVHPVHLSTAAPDAAAPADPRPAPVEIAPAAAPAPAVEMAAQSVALNDAPVSVAPPPPAPAPPAPRFKDGTFTGWGSSRHGDIQAAVEIQDGRIVSARITQCLTRYSCVWIARLPPQVVARQSPDVDYISGATQSSDAFYGAVLQALRAALVQ